MRNKYLVLVCLLFSSYFSFSQCQYFIDSVTNKLKTDKPGFERAVDNALLAEEEIPADTSLSNAYWQKALADAKTLTEPSQKAMFKLKDIYYNLSLAIIASGGHKSFFTSKKAVDDLNELDQLTKNDPKLRYKYFVAWGTLKTHNHKECDSAHKAIIHAFDTAIAMIGNSDNEELAKAYSEKSSFYYLDGQGDKIAELSEKTIPVIEALSPKLRVKYFQAIGRYLHLKQYDSKAFDFYSKAFQAALITRDSLVIGDLTYFLSNPKYFNDSLEDFKNKTFKAIGILKRNISLNPVRVNRKLSAIYQSLAEYYYATKNDTVNTLNDLRLALQYNKLGKDAYNEPLILGNMGIEYRKFGYLDSALMVQMKALDLRIKFNNIEGQMFSYGTIASVYLSKNDFKQAIEYAQKSKELSDQYGFHSYDDNYLEVMEDAYSKQGDYKEAFKYLRQLYNWTDSMTTLRNKQDIFRVKGEQQEAQLKSDYDKKTAVDKAESDASNKRHKIVLAFVLIIVLVLAAVALGIFRSLRTTRKQKALIEEQKKVVELQKDLVEEKQKEIVDSITYAKRLQDAILPPLNVIQKYLPESFVLYKPKDIVAGDFYWMEQSGNNILIAACDCTGHGVPGALVSVVCSNALNRTVKEFKITEPGKILDKVRMLVLETFEKSESDVKDGMDVSLCCINTQTKEIQWSGAYNPLWIVPGEGIKEGIVEVTPDKQPIGKHDNAKPFNTHVLKMNKGDTLYLFTDGYADQFGGPKGKKFKYKQLQETLLSLGQVDMDKQKKVLDEILESWKGNLEQVDDILVIGIRM